MLIPDDESGWLKAIAAAIAVWSVLNLVYKLGRERRDHTACIEQNVVLTFRNERLTSEIEQFMVHPAFRSLDKACVEYGRDIAGGGRGY